MNSFGYIRQAIRAKPSLIECLARTSLAVAVPTLMRWLIDRGAYGAPFLLYFPAIQMIATYLGWRWGVAAAVGSGVAGALVFMPPVYSLTAAWPELVVLMLFALSAGTIIVIGHLLRTSVLENAQRAQQSEDFNQELQHRTKNSLQMMRALASRASKATDPAEFYEQLAGRLGALAKANELLRFGALRSCEIRDLVEAAIAPFGNGQIATNGPGCRVAREACTPLMMALHELGTNANKYGSLSQPHGKVHLTWRTAENGEIELEWLESGGPLVSPPTHKGLGSRLLTPHGKMTAISVQYLPNGVICTIRVAGD